MDQPRTDRLAGARATVPPALVIIWAAALLWLAADGDMACLSADPPSCDRPAEEIRASLRFGRWFGPVLAAGPLLVLAAWATLSPRGRRYRLAMCLLGVAWLCASPILFIDGAFTAIDHGLAFGGPPQGPAPPFQTVKLIVGAAGTALTPAAMAVIAFKNGRPAAARCYGTFAIVGTAAVLMWLMLTAT